MVEEAVVEEAAEEQAGQSERVVEVPVKLAEEAVAGQGELQISSVAVEALEEHNAGSLYWEKKRDRK